MIKLQFSVTELQYEEDPTVGKNIAQLGEFAVALSRGEIDAENVDNLIANLDKLGLIPWDKTQVRRTFLIHIYSTVWTLASFEDASWGSSRNILPIPGVKIVGMARKEVSEQENKRQDGGGGGGGGGWGVGALVGRGWVNALRFFLSLPLFRFFL